ncbi:helix-turn-helix domain-containing protein [Amycolatopsis magusensis]|uniref:DNA-binding Lrp family transcriptional regulator n=1 Tax=Amycolatopsis magusensis TaxID=882444 RepID=A0ABS4PWV6_9PSEU|nr:helix-turn-helix domain-containing protein [Amycolatopsis magusensis]MBP2183338.1 DNA-binding Lrp family transcriptional regulator [Amycolatopsis magusensis]
MVREIPAVARALDVLEYALAEGRVSAGEVTARLGVPRTTAHELLATLAERGYLARPAKRAAYTLGPGVGKLGESWAVRRRLESEGEPLAKALAAWYGHEVAIAVPAGERVRVVACSGPPATEVGVLGRVLAGSAGVEREIAEEAVHLAAGVPGAWGPVAALGLRVPRDCWLRVPAPQWDARVAAGARRLGRVLTGATTAV